MAWEGVLIYLFSVIIKLFYRLKKKEFLIFILIIEGIYFSCVCFVIQNFEKYLDNLGYIIAVMFVLQLFIIYRIIFYLYGIEKNVYWNMKNSNFVLPYTVGMNSRFARKHESQILNVLERLLWTNSGKGLIIIQQSKNKLSINYFFKHREDFYEYINMIQADESDFEEVEMYDKNDIVSCTYIENIN